ncbi:hypothetical protein H072_2377 [Dactylellina haptotyla CBS 200.50]|uniref:Uncharacterized protein n=1 Tax=Dactylellina haptotyla (strain CBS 200.50) TaxID=1284197 RepID=S8BVQ7_DACHA|nr:hypothetical protein H072_2377 [Dactylellina haptotyla CBS 200.50]
MPPITHLLFDCDNTLVLSEHIAFEVCASLANEILKNAGVDKTFTGPELQSTFVGQNFSGMLKGLQETYKFTMPPEEHEAYVKRELTAITQALSEKAEPCPGVNDVLKGLQQTGQYGLAVVSSSAKPRVVASIKKAGQGEFFVDEHIYSAMTSLDPPTSKPDPAVYLFACKDLGKKPEECVAIEDSGSGTLSATRAGIWVIGYVGPYEDAAEKAAMIEKLTKNGAKVIMDHWREFGDCLKKIEALESTQFLKLLE